MSFRTVASLAQQRIEYYDQILCATITYLDLPGWHARGAGATRAIPGNHPWTKEQLSDWLSLWRTDKMAGDSLICPSGEMIILGPQVVHGAEPNLSSKPRRNLSTQCCAE